MPLLTKLRQAVLRLSRLGIRTFVNGSLIRSPDAGKGQIGGKGMMESPNLEKLARIFLIHDSLWESECSLRECCLGMDLGGH